MANIDQQLSPPGADMSSISIYRPVLNLSEADTSHLSETLEAYGLTKNLVRVTLSPNSKAEIVGPGELRRLHEHLGIISSLDVTEELVQYLESAVPDTYDDELIIPTKPAREYVRVSKKNYLIFAIGTENPEIEEERRLTKQAINDFYGIGRDTLVTQDEAWQELDYRTSIHMAIINDNLVHAEKVNRIRQVLAGIVEYLPSTITLGPASIDDV